MMRYIPKAYYKTKEPKRNQEVEKWRQKGGKMEVSKCQLK